MPVMWSWPTVVLAKRRIVEQHLIDIDVMVDQLIGFGQTLLEFEREIAPELHAQVGFVSEQPIHRLTRNFKDLGRFGRRRGGRRPRAVHERHLAEGLARLRSRKWNFV